ncbi:SCP-like extracellular protein [Phytophthora megakarya]|uniref:SCP-like extracellular protein n=1 Tax=Phytophthora megakarya TaxID=4795 RepID=A0A225VUT8_9STRA|nr:SCP-like extracellular protein [Phytophthora megakarya]
MISLVVIVPTTAGFQLSSSGRVKWESNCNYLNNDYRSVNGIPEVCGELCANDIKCTHWTWSNYNNGTCWLKEGLVSTKTTSYGAICGYVVSRSTKYSTRELSNAEMADMLGQINAFRAQYGLNAVTIDYRLVKAALLHSQDQASHCTMTHAGTTILNMGDRIKAQGYDYNAAAENVAAGQTSVADVMTSWWNSPGHRANILNKDVENVGFAMVSNRACSQYKTYWTQDFGSPSS